MHIYIRIMETTKKPRVNQHPVKPATEIRNPELIEKFYKQIVNNFGYAYQGKA